MSTSYVAYHEKTGVEPKKGDTITSFRGEEFEYLGVNQEGRNRIYAKSRETGNEIGFFSSVFNMAIRRVETT